MTKAFTSTMLYYGALGWPCFYSIYWWKCDWALLDRNGFLVIPLQRWICNHGIWNSVLDIKPEDVVQHGRLEPGKMFLLTWMKVEYYWRWWDQECSVTKRPYENG
jgi:hypothetical protein